MNACSDTPKTDKAAYTVETDWEHGGNDTEVVDADFARKLEIENKQLAAALATKTRCWEIMLARVISLQAYTRMLDPESPEYMDLCRIGAGRLCLGDRAKELAAGGCDPSGLNDD